MSLGKKISVARKNQGISQEQLAENSKISLRTIQRIESGTSVPRPFTIKVIADSLGIPLDQLTMPDSTTDTTPQSFELEKLRLINWFALTGFIIPLTNVIIPWLIWRKNRHTSLVNIIGGRIVSFQILWTIAAFLTAISIHAILKGLTNSVSFGHLPPTIFLVYGLFLFVNFIFIVLSGTQLSKGKTSIYLFAPTLI
jgi:transcriptional regulator with XRE-family HTH domain